MGQVFIYNEPKHNKSQRTIASYCCTMTMLSLLHHVEISHTPSYIDTQTCMVNITLLQVTEQLPPLSIPTFSFSFDELHQLKDQLDEHLRTMQPLMHQTTRWYVVDVVDDYVLKLASRSSRMIVSTGFVVEARVSIMHLRMVDVEKGIYKVGDCSEEVIVCPVCLEDLTPGVEFTKLPCSHMFHASCVELWCLTKKTCPYCRLKLNFERTVKERVKEFLRLKVPALLRSFERIPST